VDPSTRQRTLVFAGIVVVLVAFGAYLVWPKHSPSHAPPSHPAATASSPPLPTPTQTQTGGSTAASSPANIYQWLPFTQSDLTKAAAVTTEFSAYYGTYSYSETTNQYVSRMSSLVTSQLDGVLGNAYATPGVAGPRQQQKQVSTGTAVINSLRDFGSGSLTFVVTINQKITSTKGNSQQSQQYAVTVASSGGSWQVNNIELASAGNT
jgi:hypothetical protein